MSIQKNKAMAESQSLQEKKIFDFMLNQAQARILAARTERKVILKFKEQYFKQQ